MALIVACPSCNRKLRVINELLGHRVKCPTCGEQFYTALPPQQAAAGLARTEDPTASAADGPLETAMTAAAPAESAADPSLPPLAPPAVCDPQGETGMTMAPAELIGPSAQLEPPRLPSGDGRKPSLDESVSSPAAPETMSELPPSSGPTAPPLPPGFGREVERGEHRKICPYCRERIPHAAPRCPHCGEELDDSERDDRPWKRGVRRDAEPHRGPLVLTLGIIGVVIMALPYCAPLGMPFGITAWILGHRDLGKMKANLMDPRGQGTTQAGMIMGMVAAIMGSICLVGYLLYFGFVLVMILGTGR